MNLPPEVHSNVDLHSPSGVHSNVNLPPEVHSNVNLCSPFEAHSNVNHPLPSLKCISLEDQLNVDPPSPPLQHIPHSLKRDFNGKIKSGSGQVRPNTSISFIPSCSNLLLSSPANVLHAVGIAELLQQYPNRRFVDTITTIVTSGVRVGFEGSNLGQTSRPNHASAFAHPDIITKSIQSEISKGRIKEIDSLPANYFCSPIGLTPKMLEGKQTGWRTIFDLSSPHGHSVNDGIPKEYGSLVYETLGNAIRLVAQAGKGAVMMKRDLKSAFRHVPIDPCDYWLLMFEWQGKFYVDMFLPFGLRTAPRIFNLFAEALHWIFDTLHEWNVTHYLDDFLFVFPPGTDLSPHSLQFDQVLSSFGLSKAAEKDSNGCVVVHLGFEFNSSTMEVTLPPNKKQRAVDAVSFLLSSPSVSFSVLQETLGFLSHCCQVVPLGRPFLRNLFSLLSYSNLSSRGRRIRISRAAKIDLQWWQRFLSSWSAISLIQPSRVNHDIATDASGLKGIGGVHKRCVFSERMPTRHRSKHINFKEMFAILHAFLLWHNLWANGRIRIASDSSVIVDAINKRSIKGPAIRPLQSILLVAAVLDIDLMAFWIPSEENMVADAASRFDFKKLAELGFQVSSPDHPNPSMSSLHQKLRSFFTTQSLPLPGEVTTLHANPTNSSARIMAIHHSLPPSPRLHIGQPNSCKRSNQTPPRATLMQSAPFTLNATSLSKYSVIPGSIFSSEVENGSTATKERNSGFLSQHQSSSESSMKSPMMRKESMSRQRSVWHLPPSYDLENLHGIHGLPNITSSISLVHTSNSIPTTR